MGRLYHIDDGGTAFPCKPMRTSDEVAELQDVLARNLGGPIPMKAMADALHNSVATVNGLEYLLTWNMTHIANAELRPRIERVCRAPGYEPPVLCTPEELMGGQRE